MSCHVSITRCTEGAHLINEEEKKERERNPLSPPLAYSYSQIKSEQMRSVILFLSNFILHKPEDSQQWTLSNTP